MNSAYVTVTIFFLSNAIPAIESETCSSSDSSQHTNSQIQSKQNIVSYRKRQYQSDRLPEKAETKKLQKYLPIDESLVPKDLDNDLFLDDWVKIII